MGTLPKLYSLEDCKVLFAKHKFYLFDQNVISEGQLVDLFGPDVLPFLDRQYNYVYPFLKETFPRMVKEGSDLNEGATFRAVNFLGFCDVVSFINAKAIETAYCCTYGGFVSKVRFETEQASIAAEFAAKREREEAVRAAEVARAEAARAKRHEYYIRQKEKKAKEKQG